MPFALIIFSRFEPFSFFGDDMQQFGIWQFLHLFECLDQLFHVVTINWSEIPQAESFKKSSWCQCSFKSLFKFTDSIFCGISQVIVEE